MTAPRMWLRRKFIVDKTESTTRGSDIWKNPEGHDQTELCCVRRRRRGKRGDRETRCSNQETQRCKEGR